MRLGLVFALLLAMTGSLSQPAIAAPGLALPPQIAQQQPDWMTPEQAQLLDLGFPVLIPSWIPSPFGPEPYTIEGYRGYYRLYWLITGGDPTFFEIVGIVGGDIPDYSSYDRNNQLVVNAEVRGYPAYHDLTPIYDWVWWQEGDVVYYVNSRGFTDVSAVDVANSLIELVPPAPVADLYAPVSVEAGQVGIVQPVGVTDATLVADAGTFLATGTAEYVGVGESEVEWVAPSVETDTVVTFSLLDSASGALLASAQTTVVGVPAPPTFDIACPGVVDAGETASITVYGGGTVFVEVSAGSWPVAPPNTDYDPNTNGAIVTMTMPESGVATLVWQAPSSAQTAGVYVSGPSGMTVAECSITVQDVAQPTATVAPETPVATATTSPETPPATRTPGGPAAAATATLAPGQPTPTRSATGAVTATPTGTRAAGPSGDEENGADDGGPIIGSPGGNSAEPGETDEAPTQAPLPAPDYPSSDGTDGPRNPVYWGQPEEGEEGSEQTTPPAIGVTPSPGDGVEIPDVPTGVQPTTAPTATATVPASTAPPTRAAMTIPTATPTQRAATATSVPPTETATAAPTATPQSAERAEAVEPTTTSTVSPTATTRAVPPLSIPTATATPTIAPPTPTATATAEPTPTSTATVPPTATAVATATPRPTVVIPTATPTQGAGQVGAVAEPTATPAHDLATPETVASPDLAPTATTAASPEVTGTASPQATGVASPEVPDAASPVALTPGLASPVASPTTTVEPTTTATPTVTPTVPAETETIEQTVGPEGGTVTHPAGATLEIPARAFTAPVQVTIRSVPDSELPVSSDVDLIPGTGFDLRIVQANGTEVVLLPAPVRLHITPTQRDLHEETVIYWINGDRLEPVRSSAVVGSGVTANLDHFSRYVAGVPINEEPDLGALPWIIAAAAALSGLIVVGLLVGWSRRQKARSRWRRI